MNDMLLLFWAVIGAILLALSFRKKKASGLPEGQIVYQDTGVQEFAPSKPLFSEKYKLTGKPDYLVRQGNQLIPVEVKSTPAPAQPYANHVAQVMAYCLLIEDIYQVIPTHGVIRYTDHSFDIPYTQQEYERLVQIMADMRRKLGVEPVARSHQSPTRCDGCGYRHECDEALPAQNALI